MSVKVTNKLPAFAAKSKTMLNEALRTAATDTLISAKSNAPYNKGGLRANSYSTMERLLHWRVYFTIEYARFQEFGGDANRRVRNYSSPGTGAHFLRDAGEKHGRTLVQKFKLFSGRL